MAAGRGLELIGPTLVLAVIGLPVVVLAGLYWRLFPPGRRRLPTPALDELPLVADAAAEG